MRIGGDEAPLRLAQLRPTAVAGLGGRRAVVGQLHQQQRQLRAEALPPVALPSVEQRWILRRSAGVGFALVPQHAAQADPAQRRDHAVGQRGQARGRRPRRARRRTQLRRHDAVLPSGQRHPAAVAQLQLLRLRIAEQAAAAVAVVHVDHHGVLARVQHAAWQAVAARLVGAVAAAHRLAVDPGLVEFVHRPQRQRRRLFRLLCAQRDRAAVPDHAVEIDQLRHAPVVPGAQRRRCVAPVAAGIVRPPRRAAAVRAPPRLPKLAPARRRLLRIFGVARQYVQRRRVAVHLAQGRIADPRLHLRTAPGGVDQPHRHVHGLAQFAGEVIAGRGKRAHRLRRGRLPRGRAAELRLRGRAGLRRYLEHADRWLLRIGDLAARIQRALHRQFHVRLARTQPHVAEQHVGGALHAAVRGAGLQGIRPACRQRRQLGLPAALAVGARLHALLRQLHGHRLARRGLPPDADRRIALQHRVVLEQGIQQRCGVGMRERGHAQRRQQQAAGDVDSGTVRRHFGFPGAYGNDSDW